MSITHKDVIMILSDQRSKMLENNVDDGRIKAAYDVAIKILRKAVPDKPNPDGYRTYACPWCKSRVFKDQKYCPQCAKALLWE